MKILIIEDELPAARRLSKLIHDCNDQFEIVGIIQSVKDGKSWFKNNDLPDLIFSDIQLSDDLSFEIFQDLEQNIPIVFTTAFDEYAIRAFEYFSIDYLLKPIKFDLLCRAFEKYNNVKRPEVTPQVDFNELIKKLSSREYKSRFLIYKGNVLEPVSIDNVSYIFSENGNTYLVTKDANKFIIQETLDNLEECLDPHYFYRANRQIIVSLSSIKKIHSHFNQKLKLEVLPEMNKELFISKLKATEFKNWLDN